MGRPLYSIDDTTSVQTRQRRKEECAVLLEREHVFKWAAGDFDPDSDDFFSTAVEEFGVSGSIKEAFSSRRPSADHDRASTRPSARWAPEPSDEAIWQLEVADPSDRFPSSAPPDSPSSSQPATRVRTHFLRSTPLPSSQLAQTPELLPHDLPTTTSYEDIDATRLAHSGFTGANAPSNVQHFTPRSLMGTPAASA